MNITQHKSAKEELRKERDFITNLIHASPAFFVAIDSADKILMINKAMVQALNYSIDELIGKDYLSVIVAEKDREGVSKVFEELIKSKKPTVNENHVLTKDGRELLVEWHGSPVFAVSGEFDYFFGVGIDISERRRAEDQLLLIKKELERANVDLVNQSKELRRSLKELAVLFEASKKISSSLSLSEILDAVLDLLMDEFTIDTWSVRLLDDDGYLRIKSERGLSTDFVKCAERKPTMDSYSGECFLTDKIIIVEDAEKVTKPISTNLEVREGIKSFGLVPIEIENEVLGVLAGASKKETGYFTREFSEFLKTLGQQMALAIRNARLYEKVKNFSHDLEKEVKKRTEELRVKTELLAESEKLAALGEMADRVAHEIRNPITIIGGFARRMQRKLPADDSLKQYVDIIIKESEGLELKIYWITAFKKYISVDFESTPINSIIARALDELKDKIEEHTIKVKQDLLSEQLLVRADRKNMEFAFYNLFENAVEAMKDSGVLYIATRKENEDFLNVIVADTGKGINEENLKSIYNPFFTSKMSGAGMGLTITHKIIKDHNGSITVKSKKGEGTTFTVTLPLLKKSG